MADTNFSDQSSTVSGTTIIAAWLNAVNKWLFWSRRPNIATTTGSANAQVLTLETGSLYAIGSEADGDEFWLAAGFTNTGAMTLQVLPPAGTNVARAVQLNGQALTGGEVQSGALYKVQRLGTTWQLTEGKQLLFAGMTAQRTLTLPDANLTIAGPTSSRTLTIPDANLTIPAVTAKGDTYSASGSGVLVKNVVGADGTSVLADSSQTGGLVYIDNPGRPNLLINPNWQIDQINEGALYTVNAADVRGPDGWSGTEVGAGVFKLRTLADPDNAALKCLEITCTTADAAIAAADDYFIYSALEGYDAAALMAGTASAQPITVQFKFKSNVTGVYGLSIANSALNRRYIGIITVADTSEHEYSVSLTMDTSGTWLYTNGVGLYLRLCLAAGSNFQGTAGAWAAGAEQTTSAQANFMSVNTNIAYLKRIQLIPGALVQAYRPADIQKELAKAQRKYAKTYSQGTAVAAVTSVGRLETGYPTAGGSVLLGWRFPASMRGVPTVITYAIDGTSGKMGDGVGTNQNSTVAQQGTEGCTIAISAGNLTGMNGHASANARLS